MTYRLVLFFVIIAVSLVNAQSKLKIPKPVVKPDKNPPVNIKYRVPEERRNLPMFPKIKKKFVITEKPIEKDHLFPVRTTMVTKRPLMRTLKVTNIEDSTKFYRKPVTRRPLMKFKKFTIGLTTVPPKLDITNNKSHRLSNFKSQKSIVNSSENESDESEFEDNDEEFSDNIDDKNKMHLEKIPKMNSEESKKYEYATEIDVNEELETDRFTQDIPDTSHSNSYRFTSEEKDDLNEFIFIKMIMTEPVDATKNTHKLDVIEEITDSTLSRIRRKINIIEEENVGSTVSGFKFTGREPRLNDLTYKNINS